MDGCRLHGLGPLRWREVKFADLWLLELLGAATLKQFVWIVLVLSGIVGINIFVFLAPSCEGKEYD